MRLALLLALVAAGCAAKAKPVVDPTSHLVPLVLPGADRLCVEYLGGPWRCIQLEDLRELLENLSRANP